MEAGLTPNALQGAYPDELLLDRLAGFSRELGRIPTVGEMKLRCFIRGRSPRSMIRLPSTVFCIICLATGPRSAHWIHAAPDSGE